jgi:mxaJ protein
LTFAFDISVGVRRGEDALAREIEEVLTRKKPEVDALLRAYGVPCL